MFYRYIIILLLLTPLFIFPAKAQVNAYAAQTGKLEFSTSSAEIIGEDAAKRFSKTLAKDDKIKWSIFVPDKYDPAKPPGIVVHMTQRNLAKTPIGWNTVLKEQNLIMVALNKTGQLKLDKEMLIAVLSTAFIQDKYEINRERVYIVASADSCYPASVAMEIYPDVFNGAVYSTCEPFNWRNNTPLTIEQMKDNSYLFVSSNEKNIRGAMRRSYQKYKDAGLTKVEYLRVQKLFYGRQMDRRTFKKSISILDNL